MAADYRELAVGLRELLDDGPASYFVNQEMIEQTQAIITRLADNREEARVTKRNWDEAKRAGFIDAFLTTGDALAALLTKLLELDT